MKILDSINSPQDIKKLNIDQLNELCQEIRQYIIESLAHTGGHLASSLGAVELTVALHYVFDSPEDKIVWDVGHQGYAHKILTGRREAFKTNRQYGGISGFIKYGESPHDHVTVGHSSTSISAALGLATARDLKKENFHVISVIGDGALTGGMAFEALNNAGAMKKNMLVILNDNNMSISRNVGAISEYLTKLITQPLYVRLKNQIWEKAGSLRELGHYIRRAGELIDDGMKAITPGLLFEEMGFDYFGPIDGHNLELLIEILNRLKNINGPLFLHVLTQKGKGFKPAEKDATTFHGVGKFKVVQGEVVSKSKGISYTKLFSDTLLKLAENDERIVAITAAMETGTGLDAFHQKFPDRFFDVGIAEQHAVTFGANLARMGLRPVVAIYSTFLQRAYDQIIHDVALDKLPVIFAIDRGGLVGEDGPTHHGVFDLSYLRLIPNMVIMAPGGPEEFMHMLHTAVQYDDGPIAIRYPRASVQTQPEIREFETIPVGTGQKLIQGEKIAILAIGSMVDVASQVADQYRKDAGFQPTVINVRFIKPLDEKLLHEVFRVHELIVTLEENTIIGGLGAAVSEWVHHHFIHHPPILQLGIPDRFITHGARDLLLDEVGLVPDKCLDAIRRFEKNLKTYKSQIHYEELHF